MKKPTLYCKEIEYTGKFLMAFHRRDYEKAKRLAVTELVIYRLQARAAHTEAVSKHEEIRALNRLIAKAKADGVKFPMVKLRVRKLQEERDTAEKELAHIGERIHNLLQLWQASGATFEDLCNICNRDPAQVRRELLGEDLDKPFADMLMIHNLDYKIPHDTGWLEDSVDAPFTHALKAYLLDTMLNTAAGRRASHEALEAVFPEIMERVLTESVDADGIRRLIDKDGVEVAVLDKENE